MADATITELTVNNNLSAVNYIPISDGTQTTRLASSSLFGYRNRLINGGFNIAQRGTTISNAVSGEYSMDRWKLICMNSTNTMTVTQNSLPFSGALNSMKVLNSNSGNRIGVAQIIEFNNCADLRGKQVTLSFKIKSNSNTPGGIYVSIIEYRGTADSLPADIFTSIPSTSLPPNPKNSSGFYLPQPTGSQVDVTPLAVDTWHTPQPITVTLGNTFNNILISFTRANSETSKYIELAQVQLEEGPTATPFEFRPISTELAMCQRYYLPIDLTAAILSAHYLNGNTQVTAIPFSVPMRSTPIASWGTLTGTFWNGVANAPLDVSTSAIDRGNTFWRIGASGNPGGIYPAMINLTGRIFFTSEL